MENDETIAAADNIDAPDEAEPQKEPVRGVPLLEALCAELDTACGLLAESHQKLKELCNKFEALLDVPGQTLAVIRKASAEVRAAGMLSMGLTTKYLTALNDYMKIRQ